MDDRILAPVAGMVKSPNSRIPGTLEECWEVRHPFCSSRTLGELTETPRGIEELAYFTRHLNPRVRHAALRVLTHAAMKGVGL